MSSSIAAMEEEMEMEMEMEMEIPERYAEIVVVRHGETTWNASRILQGQLDSVLNEIGRQQAAAVANHLSKEPKFNAIYSSDLKRAADTAQIIANQCGLKEVILDEALRERHLGDLQGLTIVDAQKMKPSAYKAFLAHKRDQEIPGAGESLDQLHERCVSSFRKIASQHKGERVIVVSHGGFIRELYRKAAPNRKLEGKIQNTSVSVVLISASNNRWFIKKWGDTSHLQGIGMLDSGFGGDKTSG
ncbi:Phosphoglycerate mutase family protein [Rhynchospora pubera]|uniref:Phosphoglycerate mutase family protein n=1 Tax=Rhynchospora pubera TaxID=906938 RepID=A0AAV8G7M1_9POAL|nr:Phosphoglycerate mutase family protein [Rhynchospora pubera]